ncbi:MAG: EI24 domain-containing protein [Phaeodactylibacter sp.]|uniref:EI24 domain-containing protein n=1 Tax=Phaeodactylibacter sp. TaxID=1940289 RepID=UPI0032EDDB2F
MITGFFQGFTSYLDAIRLTSRYRLWGYVLAPGLISVVLGAVIFYGAWNASDDIAQWLIDFYPFDWGKGALETIVQIFGGVFVLAIGLVLFRHLVLALSSPFMSFLSEKIEKRLTGQQPQVPFSIGKALSDLRRGLTLALRNIVRELFFTLLLFLLGILLPFLSPLIAVAVFGVQAYYAGFGNLDFTLERHRDVQGSIAFARAHRGLCLGNGTAFLLLLFTIVGFLFALPLGTIAATKEAVRRLY